MDFYKSLQDHGFHFFYYNYKNNSLEQIFPVCEKNLLEEPTAFSSNITLIIDEKLSEFREKVPFVAPQIERQHSSESWNELQEGKTSLVRCYNSDLWTRRLFYV